MTSLWQGVSPQFLIDKNQNRRYQCHLNETVRFADIDLALESVYTFNFTDCGLTLENLGFFSFFCSFALSKCYLLLNHYLF